MLPGVTSRRAPIHTHARLIPAMAAISVALRPSARSLATLVGMAVARFFGTGGGDAVASQPWCQKGAGTSNAKKGPL
jgi:hypothetical protein